MEHSYSKNMSELSHCSSSDPCDGKIYKETEACSEACSETCSEGGPKSPWLNDEFCADEMKKFRRSMEMKIIQCVVCKEAWPLRKSLIKKQTPDIYV